MNANYATVKDYVELRVLGKKYIKHSDNVSQCIGEIPVAVLVFSMLGVR